MKIGTKSVLYGAHCFFIHPWFVALAWWKLYGFPFDLRLWVAFFVHDLGYWGKPNMDGPEGEAHPYLGAKIMQWLFDRKMRWDHSITGYNPLVISPWFCFTLYHSRFLAKNHLHATSKLCPADKLATAITPRWLYMILVKSTGEIYEYMGMAGRGKYQREESKMFTLATGPNFTPNSWHKRMTDFMREWAWKNK